LFKLIAAVIALVLFPVTIPLLVRASSRVDGVTLLAGYHTAYNVVGVAVLLPLIDRFTKLVERILPERASPLTRCLDPAALVTPLAAEEAVRRTVARCLGALCASIGAELTPKTPGVAARPGKDAGSVAEAGDALRRALHFMSEASGPPESEREQERLTWTLHALDDAARLAEVAGAKRESAREPGGPDDDRAAELCAKAMRHAAAIAEEVGALPGAPDRAAPVEAQALSQLQDDAKTLRELRETYRRVTLGSVAGGALSADKAMTRVDAVRRLEAIAYHAWRSAANLVGSEA